MGGDPKEGSAALWGLLQRRARVLHPNICALGGGGLQCIPLLWGGGHPIAMGPPTPQNPYYGHPIAMGPPPPQCLNYGHPIAMGLQTPQCLYYGHPTLWGHHHPCAPIMATPYLVGTLGVRHHRAGAAQGRTPPRKADQPQQHPRGQPGTARRCGAARRQGYPG